jgi:hypothetical protein
LRRAVKTDTDWCVSLRVVSRFGESQNLIAQLPEQCAAEAVR